MSSDEVRLAIFRKLPLRAQLAFIAASRENPVLAADTLYIASLERVHQECLDVATPEQLALYQKF